MPSATLRNLSFKINLDSNATNIGYNSNQKCNGSESFGFSLLQKWKPISLTSMYIVKSQCHRIPVLRFSRPVSVAATPTFMAAAVPAFRPTLQSPFLGVSLDCNATAIAMYTYDVATSQKPRLHITISLFNSVILVEVYFVSLWLRIQ
jgi:hypothetical protein